MFNLGFPHMRAMLPCSTSSLTLYDIISFQIFTPLVLAVLFGCVAWTLQRCCKHLAASYAWNAVWLILFTVTPSVTYVVFSVFDCLEVNGDRYMLLDMRLSCDDDSYAAYLRVAIPGLLLYPIGVPLLFFVAAWSNAWYLYVDQHDVARARVLQVLWALTLSLIMTLTLTLI